MMIRGSQLLPLFLGQGPGEGLDCEIQQVLGDSGLLLIAVKTVASRTSLALRQLIFSPLPIASVS